MELPLPRRSRRPYTLRDFLVSVAIPVVCMAVSTRYAPFATIPYSLSFLAIVSIAILDGTIPSLIGIAVTVLTRAVCLYLAVPRTTLDRVDFIRIVILLLVALLISLLTRNQRRAAVDLQSAHADLQERTDALIESLQASRCASWSRNFSLTGNINWYSGSFQIYGRPFPEEQDQSALLDFLHPDDRQALAAMVEHMRTSSEPVIFDYRVFWPNGEMHWLEARANRVPGKDLLWRGVTVDITERKVAEQAVLSSEKLAAMGRLASTVAHEINNPLESVTNLLYLVGTDRTLSTGSRQYLNTAEQELARLGDITRLTLGFVRNTAIREQVEVAPIVEDVLAIFRHRLESRNIEVVRRFDPGVGISIVPHELRQILTNLISNAVDALTVPSPCLAVEISGVNGATRLVIEDNGRGISPAELGRIFEPFFTTKQNVGTGIGLWVTRELVKSSGGHIQAESGDLPGGMRTRFQLDFPHA